MDESTPLIAVVDDDESIRRALSRLLRVGGFRVEAFASAALLLETLPGRGFACLILDIHLGGMSGLDLMESLSEAGSKTPVIIITASESESAEERATRGGASAFLRKPLDAEVLLAQIRKAVGLLPAA
jgi:FixJ family two-component response regulator